MCKNQFNGKLTANQRQFNGKTSPISREFTLALSKTSVIIGTMGQSLKTK